MGCTVMCEFVFPVLTNFSLMALSSCVFGTDGRADCKAFFVIRRPGSVIVSKINDSNL